MVNLVTNELNLLDLIIQNVLINLTIGHKLLEEKSLKREHLKIKNLKKEND